MMAGLMAEKTKLINKMAKMNLTFSPCFPTPSSSILPLFALKYTVSLADQFPMHLLVKFWLTLSDISAACVLEKVRFYGTST